MEKRPKLVILQAKKPVNLQLFFTVMGKHDFTLTWGWFKSIPRQSWSYNLDQESQAFLFLF